MLKNKHDKLKEICEVIWHQYRFWFIKDAWFFIMINDKSEIIDERTLIYTQDFMDKLIKFLKPKVDERLWWWFDVKEYWIRWSVWKRLLKRLDDPIWFLYKLIKFYA